MKKKVFLCACVKRCEVDHTNAHLHTLTEQGVGISNYQIATHNRARRTVKEPVSAAGGSTCV